MAINKKIFHVLINDYDTRKQAMQSFEDMPVEMKVNINTKEPFTLILHSSKPNKNVIDEINFDTHRVFYIETEKYKNTTSYCLMEIVQD